MSGIMNQTGAVSGILGTTVGTPASTSDPTPAFAAYLSSDQSSLAQGAMHRVNFNTEIFDSDSAYSHDSTYSFVVPSGKAGYYLFNATVRWTAGGGSNTTYDSFQLQLRVDDTSVAMVAGYFEPDIQNACMHIQHIVNLSVGGEVDIYAYSDQGSGTVTVGGNVNKETRFNGTYLGV